jgi:two-component system, chemotaxis family, protein-glutamate methylesterase/glutaminase
MTENKIKVLVIDDSHVYREVIARGISSDPTIEVVATAQDPYDARDKILKYHPDVLTCDIEMPKMNGIEFIKRLIPQYPIPVVVVSSVTESVFEAINSGAVEFLMKPDVMHPKSVENFLYELIAKIKIASRAKIIKPHDKKTEMYEVTPVKKDCNDRIIAIGASTGGTEAIYSILKKLPNTVPGIVIVQHIPSVFSKMFAERLNRETAFQVKEAKTGDIVEQGKVFIAPGDKHMKIVKMGNYYRINCHHEDRINWHCPSVDVLFESVAKEAGKKAIGIILTGMGYDGAKGLLAMKRNGAWTIGQNEFSSVVYGMPKAAFNIGAVDIQGSLDNIPRLIIQSLNL